MSPSRSLIALLFGGMLVTAADLLLLGHYEDWWQKAPLGVLALGLIALPLRHSDLGRRLWLLVLGLFVVSGFVGWVQHFRGNAEFERELSPGLSGLDLAWESLQGATPALAPATMIGLGALGLIVHRFESRAIMKKGNEA